jgi:hypothetical protein
MSGKICTIWAEALIYQKFRNPSLKAGVTMHSLLRTLVLNYLPNTNDIQLHNCKRI